jgi:dCMP deaminase|tara:strand:+ start:206 stop:640 length:435 start_codon:yes stop_codon:yes gene_type:complete
MKQKFIDAHMKAAEVYAELSTAKRLQVGCVIVKDNTIIGIGYNGMPSGWDNVCEVIKHTDFTGTVVTMSKPEVLHAETNAIAKVAKSTNSTDGATMFITHAPCLDCAKLVYQSGINSVYYRDTYKNDDGLKFLEKCNIKVEKYE